MKKKRFKQNKNYQEIDSNQSTENKKSRELFKYKKRGGNTPFKKIEYPKFLCAKCGLAINELSSAIGDKETGNPVHFKCVIDFLKKAEDLKEKEDIIYIGNGNFAIVYFENPKNRKDFKINKLIQWEDKNKEYEWKTEIANLASKV